MSATTEAVDARDVEPVESFRLRARAWLKENFPRETALDAWPPSADSEEDVLAAVARARQHQRLLFDGGLAGVCFPVEYGGLGLTPAHQYALNKEIAGYAIPRALQIPSFVPCAAILYEFGTEEQKRRHLPAILRGDEIWMQLLSEPSGGSDVAGALTTAVRDGADWILNGSKIWTSGAWFADYGLCLVRTNWDAPKHRGLTVFIVDLRAPGVEVQQLEMINGSREFCQEFFTDVRLADADRVGEVDDGWTVGTRWMFHEKNAMGGGSPYVTGGVLVTAFENADRINLEIARTSGHLDDSATLELLGESTTLELARAALVERALTGMAAGVFPDSAAALIRLQACVVSERHIDIAMELAGANAVAAADGDPLAGAGFSYLERQVTSIGGGTSEMARSNIAERMLAMPREISHDKNVAFRDIPKGPTRK
jgi:alkylation response protein AidB-like acyl-CoA dehydrogenase